MLISERNSNHFMRDMLYNATAVYNFAKKIALQVSRIADSEKSVMLMLGRCLPHIVPNVLLAKREVRNVGIFVQFHTIFIHLELCIIYYIEVCYLQSSSHFCALHLYSQKMVAHLCQVSFQQNSMVSCYLSFCLRSFKALCRAVTVSPSVLPLRLLILAKLGSSIIVFEQKLNFQLK